jgi:FKBP-type peptidyl-prolyl cis-trans isomerase FkpA
MNNVLKVLFIMVMIFTSCKKDDDNGPGYVPRDRGEQQAVDLSELKVFFETHYYNSADFEGVSDKHIQDIVISRLNDEQSLPEGKTLLKNVVDSVEMTYLELPYKLYYLKLNEGGTTEDSFMNFSDEIDFRYEGNLISSSEIGSTFDYNYDSARFGLLGLIPGYKYVMPNFKASTGSSIDGNGDVNYLDYGFGVMFLPSGLAYFDQSLSGVPSYSNLIFKFEVNRATEMDHDLDGVPTHLEISNDDNGNYDVSGYNLDNDSFPNYLDNDDDGDGVLTINEDINHNGDPTDDDTNGNGIPNYLDLDSTESK